MTTLVGIQGDGWCAIAADSRTTLEHGRMSHTQRCKIFTNGGLLIASAGAVRGNNLLQHAWVPPKPKARQNLDNFMTTDLMPSMRRLFVKNGYDMKDDGDVAMHDNEFLIAVRGVLYHVYEDYSWERTDEGFYASGTGGDYALSALMSVQKYVNVRATEKDAEEALRLAVGIAKSIDIYSGGDVQVEFATRPLTRGSNKVPATR